MVKDLLKDRWFLGKIERILSTLDPRPGIRIYEGRIPPASWGIPEDYQFLDWGEEEGYTSPFPMRRLILIPDKEGKTREVAVFDYWSQTILRPVHAFLFGILRVIPQDMTFNQGGFVEVVKG